MMVAPSHSGSAAGGHQFVEKIVTLAIAAAVKGPVKGCLRRTMRAATLTKCLPFFGSSLSGQNPYRREAKINDDR